MMKRTYALAGLGLSALVLASCDSENNEEVQSAVNEVDQIHDELITNFNTLTEEETALQSAFDETMNSDQELTTLSDGSAQVFQNISSRREILNSISSLDEQFAAQEEIITAYEGETLSAQELDGLVSQIDTLSSQIDGFIEDYTPTLTAQEDYFTSLGREEATYETFTDGITELNEQTSSLQERWMSVDEALASLDTSISETQSMIESALSENE